MAIVYIASDKPGAGKTALASALAARLSAAGKRVGYFKPFSATPDDDADTAFVYSNVLPPADKSAWPATSKAPDSLDDQVLQEGTSQQLSQSIEAVLANTDVVFMEGVSLSNTKDKSSQILNSLPELADAKVLLIMQYSPSLTAERVLEACQPFAQNLIGVVLNHVTRYKEREVRLNLAPAIETKGIKVLGAIPEDRLMLSVTVGQMAQHLDGRWVLGQEKDQDIVENFLIGGNIMDSGINYFGRMDNKAVIVRGDRPDIQLAALSVPTTCLFLTGGHEPIQYVYHEAEQQEVPLVVVSSDTISTSHALDSVLESSTVHHPKKLKRFQELVESCIAVGDIESVS